MCTLLNLLKVKQPGVTNVLPKLKRCGNFFLSNFTGVVTSYAAILLVLVGKERCATSQKNVCVGGSLHNRRLLSLGRSARHRGRSATREGEKNKPLALRSAAVLGSKNACYAGYVGYVGYAKPSLYHDASQPTYPHPLRPQNVSHTLASQCQIYHSLPLQITK